MAQFRLSSGKAVFVWLALLLLAPIGLIALVYTRTGQRWLVDAAEQSKVAAILPGMTVDDAAASGAGFVVTSIRTNSQAARAGVHVGDRIVTIDGKRLTSLEQARRYLQNDKDRRVDLKLARGPIMRDVALGL